jgi:hypothetical protein
MGLGGKIKNEKNLFFFASLRKRELKLKVSNNDDDDDDDAAEWKPPEGVRRVKHTPYSYEHHSHSEN